MIIPLSDHAVRRAEQRRISGDAIERVMQFGRRFVTRQAMIFVIGKQEIQRHRDQVDLSTLNGVHVVLAPGGPVITVYRNRNFHRKDFAKSRRFRSRIRFA